MKSEVRSPRSEVAAFPTSDLGLMTSLITAHFLLIQFTKMPDHETFLWPAYAGLSRL
jgi:hypothetical protein